MSLSPSLPPLPLRRAGRLLAALPLVIGAVTARAQSPTSASAGLQPPPVRREMRGVWVATVGNIDWPSKPGLSTWEQQRELLAILNRAVELRLNAIVFQIRPGTDALYASRYEPWSEYLTGRQGRAPEPLWDPLKFAVDEAHRRGLELHAWFNPYRARYAKPLGEAARTHVSRTAPGLVRQYGSYLWMDPGEPEVRRRAERIVLDVVRRYDIDGVHIDDYFYPYREKDTATKQDIDFPDSASYARYLRSGGKLAQDDWRRENVNLLVKELYRGIHRVKPWVQFGISPIGSWRPDNPPGVRGFDAYQSIYADTRKWLVEGWCDYWVPQLYQAIASTNPYPVMLRWWTDPAQNPKGRHVYAGNGLHRVGTNNVIGASGNRALNWPASEIVEQVRLTRQQPGAEGNVLFSMKALMRDVDSLDEKLAREVYQDPALVPASPWLGKAAPARPSVASDADPATGERELRLAPGAKGGAAVWLWVVQTHVPPTAAADSTGGAWTTEILPGWQRSHRLAVDADVVRVSAVGRTGQQSRPTVIRVRR